VVGLGHISERAVLPAFRHAKKSRLISLVSGDPEKAKKLASKFKASHYFTYDRLEECLQDPEVEAVYIATNNGSHLDFTLRAAKGRKHVLCEKPLANTTGECRRMVEACRANDVYLMTAYRKYFEPAALDLKKLLSSGKLGRLKLIHSAFTFNLPAKQVWHLSREFAGGGSLLDVGIYCINTVRWLTGLEPFEASGYWWTSDPERFRQVEESISFQLKFPGELYMQGSSSFAAEKASFLQIHAEKGWVALNPAYAYNEERRLFGQIGANWFGKVYKPIEEFHLELDHFAGCIRAGREPEPNGVAGLRDVAVMETIYKAAQSGRSVPIRLPM